MDNFSDTHKKEVEQAKKGDEKAMYFLYNKYAKAMLNTSFRITGNLEEAEDVIQEVFIKVFSQLSQFNYKSSFGAWLKRIVINQSINSLKKRNQSMFLVEDIDSSDEEYFPQIDSKNDFEKELTLLYESLHLLPDGYRTVFSLFMLEGYDHEEIATILGIGISTSISQLSRAKKKIKSLISKKNLNGQVEKYI